MTAKRKTARNARTGRNATPKGSTPSKARRKASAAKETARKAPSRKKTGKVGGPRPGSGRPPLPPGERLVNFTIRIPSAWRDEIVAKRMAADVREAMGVLFDA